MAEKIISEYEVITKQAVGNLQAVVNEYGKVDAANTKSTNQFLFNSTKTSAELAKNATSLKMVSDEAVKASASISKLAATSKTGFNGLSNSINQITRELPAFTFSAQTGFLALSNNIPILVDNIDNLRRKNAELIEQGQPVQSVFKQIVGSLFSFQTAISLGVTLLTIYGKEVVSFIGNLFKGNEAITEAKIRLESLNSAYDSKELKNGVKGVLELRNNIELAKNGFISKEVVLKQYNETLGVSFGKVTDLDSAEQGIIKNTNAYITALIQRGAANKILDEAAQTSIDIRREEARLTFELQEKTKKELDFINGQKFVSQEAYNKRVADLFKKNSIEQQMLDKTGASEELRDLKTKQENQFKLIADFSKNANKVLKDNGGVGTDALRSAFQILQEELSKTEDAFKSAKLKGADTTEIEARFKKLTAELKRTQEAFDELTGEAGKRREKELEDLFKSAVDEAENYSKEVSRIAEIDMKNAKEDRKEKERLDKEALQKQKEDTKLNLSEELLANEQFFFNLRKGKEFSKKDLLLLEQEELKTKITILKDYIDADDNTKKELLKAEEQFEKNKTDITKAGEEERSKLKEQILQGAFNLASTLENEIFSLRQANLRAETDFEITQLEEQRDKKLITEDEFKQKRAQALNEQAQKQRELDLAEIKVKTALAVISAIAKSPETFGLPFSAFALLEGGIQYAFASAQPLPRFAKGTDRVKGGIRGQDSVHALLMPDEAVIKANENMKYDGMSKAWNAGNLDGYIMSRFVTPAIDEANRRWEKSMNVNQSSTFIRNDNFSDKRIVKGLDSINKRLGRKEVEKVVYKRNRRLWN